MADAGIIRNRAKIDGTIAGARAWLRIEESGPDFSRFLWDFVGRPADPGQRRGRAARSRPRPTLAGASPRP